jgi:hypothetical protein
MLDSWRQGTGIFAEWVDAFVVDYELFTAAEVEVAGATRHEDVFVGDRKHEFDDTILGVVMVSAHFDGLRLWVGNVRVTVDADSESSLRMLDVLDSILWKVESVDRRGVSHSVPPPDMAAEKLRGLVDPVESFKMRADGLTAGVGDVTDLTLGERIRVVASGLVETASGERTRVTAHREGRVRSSGSEVPRSHADAVWHIQFAGVLGDERDR